MKKKNTKKSGRNFYLPVWVNEILDKEAERYGGQGTVTAASIMAFHGFSDQKKKEILKEYRQQEIDAAFADEVVESADRASAQDGKQKNRKRKRPNVG